MAFCRCSDFLKHCCCCSAVRINALIRCKFESLCIYRNVWHWGTNREWKSKSHRFFAVQSTLFNSVYVFAGEEFQDSTYKRWQKFSASLGNITSIFGLRRKYTKSYMGINKKFRGILFWFVSSNELNSVSISKDVFTLWSVFIRWAHGFEISLYTRDRLCDQWLHQQHLVSHHDNKSGPHGGRQIWVRKFTLLITAYLCYCHDVKYNFTVGPSCLLQVIAWGGAWWKLKQKNMVVLLCYQDQGKNEWNRQSQS